MRLQVYIPHLSALFIALLLCSIVVSTSPVPWPEHKLEEMNALRAKGASEVKTVTLHDLQHYRKPESFLMNQIMRPSLLSLPYATSCKLSD